MTARNDHHVKQNGTSLNKSSEDVKDSHRAEVRNEIQQYFWPHPYPQSHPPLDVTFSNGLPTTDKDNVHEVFVVSYSLFESATLALLDSERQRLVRELRQRVPEKIHYDEEAVPRYIKPVIGEIWQQAIKHEQGFNEAIDRFNALLDTVEGDQNNG